MLATMNTIWMPYEPTLYDIRPQNLKAGLTLIEKEISSPIRRYDPIWLNEIKDMYLRVIAARLGQPLATPPKMPERAAVNAVKPQMREIETTRPEDDLTALERFITSPIERQEITLKRIKRPKGPKTPRDFKLPFKCSGVLKMQLYNLFLKYEVDYKTVDTLAILDSTLSYYENKAILESYLKGLGLSILSDMTPAEVNNQIEKYDHIFQQYKESIEA